MHFPQLYVPCGLAKYILRGNGLFHPTFLVARQAIPVVVDHHVYSVYEKDLRSD